MVDIGATGLEWMPSVGLEARPDSKYGCISPRMGWNGHWNQHQSLWSMTEWLNHINHLELLGGAFAVRTFARDRQNVHV